MWGVKPENHDDYGMPHEDIRKLVNSLVYIEKNVPPSFMQTEHERMNLVFFTREFIQADKPQPTPEFPGFMMPPFIARPESEEDADEEDPSPDAV